MFIHLELINKNTIENRSYLIFKNKADTGSLHPERLRRTSYSNKKRKAVEDCHGTPFFRGME
jgi:hypothetical protein